MTDTWFVWRSYKQTHTEERERDRERAKNFVRVGTSCLRVAAQWWGRWQYYLLLFASWMNKLASWTMNALPCGCHDTIAFKQGIFSASSNISSNLKGNDGFVMCLEDFTVAAEGHEALWVSPRWWLGRGAGEKKFFSSEFDRFIWLQLGKTLHG